MTSHLNEYISNVYLSPCNYHVARSKLRHLSLTLNGIFRIDEWKINVTRRITSRWEANFGFSFTHLLIRREFVNLPLFQNNLYILRSIFIISPKWAYFNVEVLKTKFFNTLSIPWNFQRDFITAIFINASLIKAFNSSMLFVFPNKFSALF